MSVAVRPMDKYDAAAARASNARSEGRTLNGGAVDDGLLDEWLDGRLARWMDRWPVVGRMEQNHRDEREDPALRAGEDDER